MALFIYSMNLVPFVNNQGADSQCSNSPNAVLRALFNEAGYEI
jgi:hypothetical protein